MSSSSTSQASDQNIALVIGASGYLGSHIVKTLVAQGRNVRILVRKSSNLKALEGLSLDIRHGDVLDAASLRDAMQGCATVYHSVVDTRVWLPPAELYRTNVEGLVNSMEAALASGVKRFVFTSSMATIGVNPSRPVNEGDAFNWADKAPHYILSRVEAENKLIQYCKERGLPGVAMCVANTYGPGDVQPTPHGGMLWQAATGELPVALDCGAPCVDIRDAAEAMVLAEEKGRVGERYIIAAEYVTLPDLYGMAACELGRKPPRTLPLWLAYAIATVSEWIGALRGKDVRLSRKAVFLSHVFKEMDTTKARRELGWSTRPMTETVRDAIAWFRKNASA